MKAIKTSSTKGFSALMASIALLAGCISGPPTTPSPKSPMNVSGSFSAEGVSKIILRAAEAESAIITSDTSAGAIEISGRPTGGAQGYHSADRNWKETRPEHWPSSFVDTRFGPVLVISTKGEISYIHHHYVLSDVRLRVPVGVEVVRERMHLTGSGEPNLKAP